MFTLAALAFILALVLWGAAIFSQPLREALSVWLVLFGWIFFVASVMALYAAVNQ